MIINHSACTNGKDGSMAHVGKLRLNLVADTTSQGKGINSSLTKAVSDEFERFLSVDDYRIQILSSQDTIKSYDRFGNMPSEIELPEGDYRLVASNGDDLPAAFENPYFEGNSSFVVKESMDTPLEVVCSLGNARVMIEYTSVFQEAYEDYAVLLSSPFIADEFEIAKEESRPAYLQVAKEGTDMTVRIRVQKRGEEQSSTYLVPNKIKLERRQNVHLIFKTDGGAFNGIGLDVVLDNELTDKDIPIDIPDFMWEEFTKPELYPVHFKSEGEVEVPVVDGESGNGMTVGFKMLAGVGSLQIKYWRDDLHEEEAEIIDLATDEGVAKAIAQKFSWQSGEKQNLNLKNIKSGQIFLWDALNNLEAPSPEEGVPFYLYHFSIQGHNANDKPKYTDIVKFDVKVFVPKED
ncbi:DUF4493 domain-containing protein [Parabacteroides gordonii]|uniref:DUF4493 domain-containing protein n=1 Tax=Parabacteroides gordonii TaxID=574930 RepID=UPI0012FB3A6A|nr:DUF4493 domain-containing protein [Parabacteroides gordonii]MCA5585995.1 DUF4493 domain-containing protein [Parabacteroides gordonii]